MQRCDSVTIKVVCDDDMRYMLTEGKYRQRLAPGLPPIFEIDVPGLPTEASEAICDTQEVKNCCE
jgi:hypothetical protein